MTSITTATNTPPVTIYRLGHTVRVVPAIEAVQAALTYSPYAAVCVPGGPLHVMPTPLSFTENRHQGGKPALDLPAGLEEALRTLPVRSGYTVEIVGELIPLPEPVLPASVAFGTVDHDLLRFVKQYERGLIHYDPRTVDASYLIAQVARAWPGKKIAVVVKQISETRHFRDAVRHYGLDVLAVSSHNQTGHVGQVVVTTPNGLANTEVEWLDIVIVLDAIHATGKTCRECLPHAWRARMYGLLPAGADTAPLERDFLTSLFGFRDLVIPHPGCHERHVEVTTLPIAGGMPLPLHLEVGTLKRRGLWHHERRNRQMASLARSLHDNDWTQLKTKFPTVARSLSNTNPGSVVVLVENIEHALALLDVLSGWSLVSAETPCELGLKKRQRQHLRASRSPWLLPAQGMIVTGAAFANLDLSDVKVLIRGDGGLGLPPVGSQQLAQPHGNTRRLLLIDFNDRHHPLLRRWSRRRQQAYRERGWFYVGVDPYHEQVEQFLTTRPERRVL